MLQHEGRIYLHFEIDQEYFSFNIYNDYANLPILLRQHHGPRLVPKWWDVHWDKENVDYEKILHMNYPYNWTLPDEYVGAGDILRNRTKRQTETAPELTTKHPYYDPEREK